LPAEPLPFGPNTRNAATPATSTPLPIPIIIPFPPFVGVCAGTAAEARGVATRVFGTAATGTV